MLVSAVLLDVTPCKLCTGVPHGSCVGEVASRQGEQTDAIYADLHFAVVLKITLTSRHSLVTQHV